ncbi:MAG: NAD(P)/FAD-dependent oxidoreductase [Alphaproteobacteria bacterium]|nr:NAD(P)/FAD-dependent oxidoreductase [Alphaproteobacteria bacterium]
MVAGGGRDGLAALTARVRADLDLVNWRRRPGWVVPRRPEGGVPLLDVVVIGAGHAGLTAAFGLIRAQIDNILVVDRNPAGRAGPWSTFARMRTLRTLKENTGPDLGIPSLTPRAWFEAMYGAEAFARMERMPKDDYQAYLDWFRTVLDLPVRHGTEVTAIEPDDADGGETLIRLRTRGPGATEQTLLAREVVLATGIEGNGDWSVPAMVRDGVPRDRWVHSGEVYDAGRFAGRRVAVLGGGTSAFDHAGAALEAGAAAVDQYVRRRSLPRVNAWRWADGTHILGHYAAFTDLEKWRAVRHIFAVHQPPPQETWERCAVHANWRLHLGASWRAGRLAGDDIEIETVSGERRRHDALIVAVGNSIDLGARPELAAIARDAALWRDRFVPPPGEESDYLSAHPYLADDYAFTERTPGTAPWLAHVRNFTFGTMVSLGSSGSSLNALRVSVPRLVEAVGRSLFRADRTAHYRTVFAQTTPELVADVPGEALSPLPRAPA